MALRLVAEHPPGYFPGSVQQLGQRVVSQPRLIPFLATLMWQTERTDPPHLRDRVFAAVSRIYPAIPAHEAQAVARELQQVDNERDDKTRSKVVECVVYMVGPLSDFEVRAKDYACSIRDGDVRLVDPDPTRDITVDAAFLGEGTIEVHECKFDPATFLFESGDPPALPSKTRRKLEYLDRLNGVLRSDYRMTAYICISGFNADVDRLREVLKRHGFAALHVKGPRDLEAAAERT